ncbi:winged helix DNA-binding protein [uncultured Croceitalea sp.]|uniref:MarR family winged helix-turn-helix transcriptional regulator n=1 Tax=uncultured Croceitalea sp. TaxID=1798908 RepID=UPI0033062977
MRIEELIKYLVDSAIAYDSDHASNELDVRSFASWLLQQQKVSPTEGILNQDVFDIDQELTAQLGRMGRYVHSYLKIALDKTPFITDMDFAFTAILHQYGPLSKSALIKEMVYEKSSGMEVIKRLLRLNLIEQYPNPEDKRSKLLKLTESGFKAIYEAYSAAGIAAKIAAGPLLDSEKFILFDTIKKLDFFHKKIYLSNETNLNTILDIMEKNNEDSQG